MADMSKAHQSVVVTGASTGIGAEFCRQLAPRARQILAVSNEKERLREIRDEILSLGCEARILAVDLSTREGAARVAEEMRASGVDLLINNAGFVTAGGFSARDIEEQLAMVRLHVETPLILMHEAIRWMKEAGGGAIINVASMTVFEPLEDCPTYAATKAFLAHFGRSLQAEVESLGIYVQSLHPGWTRTHLLLRPGYTLDGRFEGLDLGSIPQPLWMDPPEVVKWSLAGMEEGRSLVITGRLNQKIAETASVRYVQTFRHKPKGTL